MSAIIVSALISGLLVVVEAVGIPFSKWTIAKRHSDSEAHRAAAEAALKFDGSSVADDEDPAAVLAERLQNASNQVRTKRLSQILVEVMPGPELCFLAMTIITTLFLTFNYANDGHRIALSPFLAGSPSAFPILFGTFLISAVLWVITLMWRESIAVGVQKSWVKTSIVLIVLSGGTALALCIYLLIANRG